MPLTLVKAESRGIAHRCNPLIYLSSAECGFDDGRVTGGTETVAGSVTAEMSGAVVVSIALPQALPLCGFLYIARRGGTEPGTAN